MRACRGGFAAYDGWSFVDELTVFQGFDHEQGEIDPAGEVALQDGIAHVPAPYRQALASTFLEVAASNDSPTRLAGEDTPAGFDLILDVHNPKKSPKPAGKLQLDLEAARVNILSVPGDMPAAGVNESSFRLGVIKHRLGRSRGIVVYTPRDQHGEDTIAALDRFLNDLAIVGLTGDDGDAILEPRQLFDTPRTANADDFIVLVQSMLNHILPKFSRCAYDTYSLHTLRLHSGSDNNMLRNTEILRNMD